MRYLALNMCNVMYIEKKCAGLMIDVVSSVHLKLAAKPARSAVKTVLDYTKKSSVNLGYRIWNHKSTHFIPQIQAQQVAKG